MRASYRAIPVVAVLTLLLTGAGCGADEPTTDDAAPSKPSSAPSQGAGSRPPAIEIAGLRFETPPGFRYYETREDDYAQLVPEDAAPMDDPRAMNIAVPRSVADGTGQLVAAPADLLQFFRTHQRFVVEDLGGIQVSGQDVPVLRISSPHGGVVFCTEAGLKYPDRSCFVTDKSGPAYAFVRTAEGTVLVERASLELLREWESRLSLVPVDD